MICGGSYYGGACEDSQVYSVEIRRDSIFPKIRELSKHVDTPPNLKKKESENEEKEPPPLVSETARRLEEALKKTEVEKRRALDLVTKLEEELRDAKVQQQTQLAPTNADLQTFLHMVDEQGEKQALQWARELVVAGGTPATTNKQQQQHQQHQIGFLSPLGAVPASPAAAALRTPEPYPRKPRMATPHPKRSATTETNMGTQEDEMPTNMVEVERKYHDYFIEAAHCIPFEYTTELATYYVRRPYGLPPEPADLFGMCSLTNNEKYGRRAHVSGLSSIEVAATVTADQSLVLLSGTSLVRIYQTQLQEWKDYNLEDDQRRSLGHVSYIDENATEQEYSLDEVVEGALLTREHYCATMISTAIGFKDRPPIIQEREVIVEVPTTTQVEPPSQPVVAKKPEIREICVGTEDLLFLPPATDKGEKADASKIAPEKSVEVHPETSGSSDVVTVFLGWLISSVLSLLWTIFIGLPLAIVRTTLVMTVSIALVSLIWMYAANDNGAYHMGATTTSLMSSFNRPGIL